MYKICLTGGPGGGKSQSLSKIVDTLTSRGYKTFIIPETATELMENGVIPGNIINTESFQQLVLDQQLSKEAVYEAAAKFYDKNKVVIICDRGIGDQLAYIDKNSFDNMIKSRNLTMTDVIDRYDLVIHLVTAADGAEEYYEWSGSGCTCKNKKRDEPPQLARERDKATLNGWVSAGCHMLKIIDNSTDFNEKINRVLVEVFNLLGEPVPTEIERKFLINYPDVKSIQNVLSKSNIIQTYLTRKEAQTERRVRQRGSKENGYSFTYTEKTNIGNGKRIEIEDPIYTKEYLSLLMDADISLHQIKKDRYCFVYKNQFFELDIYPFSTKYAILEIELSDIKNEVILPDFLDVIKEVTDDVRYKNSSLAKNLSLQL